MHGLWQFYWVCSNLTFINLRYHIDSFSFEEKEYCFKQFKICLKKSSDYYAQLFWKLHKMICSFIQPTLKKVNLHKEWVLCIWVKLPRNSLLLFWVSLNFKIRISGSKSCSLPLSLAVYRHYNVVWPQGASQKWQIIAFFWDHFEFCLKNSENRRYCFPNFSMKTAPTEKTKYTTL